MVCRLLGQRGRGGRAPPLNCEATFKGMASQQSKNEEAVEESWSMVGILRLMGLRMPLLVGEWEEAQTTAFSRQDSQGDMNR